MIDCRFSQRVAKASTRRHSELLWYNANRTFDLPDLIFSVPFAKICAGHPDCPGKKTPNGFALGRLLFASRW
jgi:hypothetical protein